MTPPLARLARLAVLAAALAVGACQDMIERPQPAPVVAAPPPAPPAPVDQIAGRPTVIEGDLIEIDGQRVRIQAVDAPAIDTKLGKRAMIEMRRIVGRDPVECQLLELEAPTGKGRQAWVARCRSGETDIGQELVRRGWARALQRYGDSYVIEEAQARAAGRGMWPKPPPARPASKPKTPARKAG
ncbi:thermonuclease family protein [Stella sp.]|uniref:thermonuclease family protein n=1 Tax=Stella sp. TaxID=2912054 RepID=UPI0035B1E656